MEGIPRGHLLDLTGGVMARLNEAQMGASPRLAKQPNSKNE